MSMDMYGFWGKTSELYGTLQDDLSKDVFRARLRFDLEPSRENMYTLVRLSGIPADYQSERKTQARLQEFSEKGKLILYGTGSYGRTCAARLKGEGIDFFGFCTRNAHRFADGLLGKPVCSPDILFEKPREYYVQIASDGYYGEILDILHRHGFPENHIVTCLDPPGRKLAILQYFEFMEYYRQGTAFIDGGCYNGYTSFLFAQHARGVYSKILAFEPDPENIARCRRFLETRPICRFELKQAGLFDRTGIIDFAANGSSQSRVLAGTETSANKNSSDISNQSIRIMTIDDMSTVETVGMIKLDIEGSELAALHGAEKTLRRDRPLMAVCVYHKPGDTLTVMDYLRQTVPEYRFWLRHYGDTESETVLYAAVV